VGWKWFVDAFFDCGASAEAILAVAFAAIEDRLAGAAALRAALGVVLGHLNNVWLAALDRRLRVRTWVNSIASATSPSHRLLLS
jgi:hypothetical protein